MRIKYNFNLGSSLARKKISVKKGDFDKNRTEAKVYFIRWTSVFLLIKSRQKRNPKAKHNPSLVESLLLREAKVLLINNSIE